MNARLVALLALLLCAAPPRAAEAQGAPTSSARASSAWISDETGTLDAATRQRLDAVIADAWARASTRLAVALVRDTGARSIEDYALDRFRLLELGEATDGHGALLVVATQTRRNHIEVGTATLEAIPDATQRYILDEVFRPTARARGPAAATLRAVEAMRDRLVARLEGGDARLPEGSEPGFQERFDRWFDPHRKEFGLAVIAGCILYGLLALRRSLQRERQQHREAFAKQADALRTRARFFRALPIEGRETPPAFGERESAALSATVEPVEAFLAPLERRVEASKKIWSLRQADDATRLTWLVEKTIKRTDHVRYSFENAQRVIASVDTKVSTTVASVEKARTAHAAAVHQWPRAQHDVWKEALDRALAAAKTCVVEHQRLTALVRRDDVQSVIEHKHAFDVLDGTLDRVGAEAAKAERCTAEFREAARQITSLRTELDVAEPRSLLRKHANACAAQIANIEGAWTRASNALEARDDSRVALAALLALQQARVSFESSPTVPPARSFDASTIDEAGSSDGGSSDCGSSGGGSSDCASSDCGSSDCGSSDCGSSDCSSSDCSGSSSDW